MPNLNEKVPGSVWVKCPGLALVVGGTEGRWQEGLPGEGCPRALKWLGGGLAGKQVALGFHVTLQLDK